MKRSPVLRAAASVTVAVLGLAACGDDDGGGVACSPVEQLTEPRAPTHVLPGVEVDYQYHPPTGGPHVAGFPEAGVRDEPLSEPEQATALELGHVIVQYDPESLDEGEIADLEAVADTRSHVIVMPKAGTIDGGYPVAFTAWGHRQRCSGAAPERAEEFADSGYEESAPGEDS